MGRGYQEGAGAPDVPLLYNVQRSLFAPESSLVVLMYSIGSILPLTQPPIGRHVADIAEQTPRIRSRLIHSGRDIDKEGAHKPGVDAGASFYHLSPILHPSILPSFPMSRGFRSKWRVYKE